MKQISAFPEIVPDREIKIRASFRTLRSKAISFVKKEGVYNFAKVYEELKSRPESYFMENYQKEKKFIIGTLIAIFGDITSNTITLEEFLNNVKKLSNYRLPEWCDEQIRTLR